jgi:hypothetical protein
VAQNKKREEKVFAPEKNGQQFQENDEVSPSNDRNATKKLFLS